MALPFVKDNDKRKYQCFICGMMFEEFDAYKDHIVAEHEEGREYIVCPLKRCGAPVRDMKMHFRVKHPKEPLPKNCPHRAIVWKDPRAPKTKKGKVKTQKPRHISGSMISLKNGGKERKYRSRYECQTYECLEALNEVIAYDVEPFKIPYYHNGERKNYIPDLSIHFADGSIEIWEIKPATQTMLEINEKKWAAAKAFCEMRGWQFHVITEVGINKLKKKLRDQNRLI